MSVELILLVEDRLRRFSLTTGRNLVGSDAGCAVHISDPTVSRRHAILEVGVGGDVEVSDLGSLNGTRIGSRSVTKAVLLSPGAAISFGAVSAVIEEIPDDDAEPAVLLSQSGTWTDVSKEVEGSPSETAAIAPFDLFLANGLPPLVELSARRTEEKQLLGEAGDALFWYLPISELHIVRPQADGRDSVLIERSAAESSEEAGRLVRESHGRKWIVHFYRQSAARLYAPLVDVAIGVVDLASRPTPSTAASRVRVDPPPPPLPAPPTKVEAVETIYQRSARIARSEVSVLLRGESGTGKEVLAHYIHAASSRSGGPFVALNCAALPASILEAELFGIEKGVATGVRERRGTFERADGGTLFLDEVGDLALETQAKLLRVLQGVEVFRLGGSDPIECDVRVIAATNRDVDELLALGELREDFYYRIADWQVELPPLRERIDDIPYLAAYFLEAESKRLKRRIRGISRRAMSCLTAYHWPGNIRQLKAEIARVSLLLGPRELLNAGRFDVEIRQARSGAEGGSLKSILHREERGFVAKELASRAGNRRETAVRLGISVNTLYRKLKQFGLGGGDE